MKKDGYNRKNYLLRVEQVNKVFLQHSKRGLFTDHIYRDYIRDQFFISRSTFYNYLGIPYKKELEELNTVFDEK